MTIQPELYPEIDNSFAQFDLPPALTTALLRMKYNNPTPIQAGAIPVALQGRDILGSARTGTGKTAAFAIPVIARLMLEPQAAALIMSPTRELAAQILAAVDLLLGGRGNPIRTALLIGGESMGRQFDQLRGKPRIIIGTPGRINDHLRRDPNMFKKTNLLVLDEADRMLDMGFAPQIDEIIKTMPKERQTLMFSATFADSIIKFAQAYLTKPERISVDPVSVSAVNIKHETVQTTDANKYNDFVAELEKREGSIIVFVRTKHGADRLAKRLGENHSAGVIHGGLRQNQRDRAILAFRNKKTRIMVATDVAARGLDVPHVRHVVNYDLPQCTEDYIHRVGRTARAGAEGSAVCMILPSDRGKWTEIEHMLNGTKAARPQQRSGGNRSQPGGGRRHGAGSGDSRNYANASARKNGDGRGFNKPRGNDFSKSRDDRGGDKMHAPRPFAKAAEHPSFAKARDDKNVHAGKPQGEGRSFDKPRGDRNFSKPHSEGRSFDKPRGERNFSAKPHGEERSFDKPRDGKNFGGGKPQDEGRSFDKPRGERKFGDKPQGAGRSFDKPRDGKNFGGGKPQGEGRPFNKGPRDDRGGKGGKKKDGARPFQFKQHSRKPRPESGGGGGNQTRSAA